MTHPRGRPPKYNNCIDFDGMCEAYFEECDDNTFNDGTNDIPFPEPYLKSGLALFLELTTESMRLYSKDRDSPFFAIIKRNYDRIQNDLEKRAIMQGKQAVGCLFNLKCNFGMVETNKVEHAVSEGKDMEWRVTYKTPKKQEDK